MPISERGRREIRAAIQERHASVAKRIEMILAGQNVQLDDLKLPQEEDPSEPPLERLRRFMYFLNAVRRSLDGPDYGRCRQCGAEIPEEALVEVPWADRCRICAARSGGGEGPA